MASESSQLCVFTAVDLHLHFHNLIKHGRQYRGPTHKSKAKFRKAIFSLQENHNKAIHETSLKSIAPQLGTARYIITISSSFCLQTTIKASKDEVCYTCTYTPVCAMQSLTMQIGLVYVQSFYKSCLTSNKCDSHRSSIKSLKRRYVLNVYIVAQSIKHLKQTAEYNLKVEDKGSILQPLT